MRSGLRGRGPHVWGLLPWLAAFLRRAFFLRRRLDDMSTRLLSGCDVVRCRIRAGRIMSTWARTRLRAHHPRPQRPKPGPRPDAAPPRRGLSTPVHGGVFAPPRWGASCAGGAGSLRTATAGLFPHRRGGCLARWRRLPWRWALPVAVEASAVVPRGPGVGGGQRLRRGWGLRRGGWGCFPVSSCSGVRAVLPVRAGLSPGSADRRVGAGGGWGRVFGGLLDSSVRPELLVRVGQLVCHRGGGVPGGDLLLYSAGAPCAGKLIGVTRECGLPRRGRGVFRRAGVLLFSPRLGTPCVRADLVSPRGCFPGGSLLLYPGAPCACRPVRAGNADRAQGPVGRACFGFPVPVPGWNSSWGQADWCRPGGRGRAWPVRLPRPAPWPSPAARRSCCWARSPGARWCSAWSAPGSGFGGLVPWGCVSCPRSSGRPAGASRVGQVWVCWCQPGRVPEGHTCCCIRLELPVRAGVLGAAPGGAGASCCGAACG